MTDAPEAAEEPEGPAPVDHPRSRTRRRRRHKPGRYRDLPAGAWRRIARRTFDHFRSDGLTNLAAALTYRSILSVVPGLVALIALLGVLGEYPGTFDAVLNIIGGFAPKSVSTVADPVRTIITHKGGARALFGAGLLASVWAASGYMGTLAWASNVIWEASRGRSWYRQWPLNILITFVTVVILVLVLSALVLTGPVARSVGAQLGIASATIGIWSVAKWPLIVIVMTLMISALYYTAPNVKPPGWRWLTPGAGLAVVAWVVVTLAFGVYIAHFGSYDRTYGALGGIIGFLVWVWLTNIAMLLGVELDSEIERERQLAARALAPGERLRLPLRQS